jgi:hypothetical protein
MDIPDFMREFFDKTIDATPPDCAAFERALKEVREAFAGLETQPGKEEMEARFLELSESVFTERGLHRDRLVEMTVISLMLLGRKKRR